MRRAALASTVSSSRGADADAIGASTSASAGPASAQPGQQSRGSGASSRPPLRLQPFTLAYGDAALDAAYAKHQQESQLAVDQGSHAFHLVISVVHTGYSAYAVTGSLVSPAALSLMVPYLLVALLHWCLSHMRGYARHRLALVLSLEAAYAAVCTLTMPRWVLAPASSWKHYLKDFTLGSGVLISTWVTVFCLKPVFWVHYITIPLEFLFQTLMLTRPVCASLTATQYGRDTTTRIAKLLDSAAAAGAIAAPSCPPRGGEAGVSAAASCGGMMLTWQVVCCLTLLYGRYRLERGTRLKFAAASGRGPVQDNWPPTPVTVQVVMHVALYTHIASALWAWLGCSSVAAAAAS